VIRVGKYMEQFKARGEVSSYWIGSAVEVSWRSQVNDVW
jgi:hypothetical protein